jgi:NAD(P)-dependent dehydrogenase (short-subunit alcohol dehydrogenase family)
MDDTETTTEPTIGATIGATIDLDGQVAIVTGASSGLGRRFAQVLAANGARVVATARRLDRLEDLAADIGSAGGTCVPLQLDVTDAARIADTVAAAERLLGPVQILVNNAGIPDAQYATKMPVDLVDRVLDTNLRAPFLLSCEVARRLIEQQLPGRIVNISSVGGFHYAGGGAALYSISKAGVNRLTEALAVEWAKFGINVNAIAPGLFASEMSDGMIERMGDLTRAFPRRRIGQPEHLDSTLLYLVSPESEMVTGTVVKVDDGQGPR